MCNELCSISCHSLNTICSLCRCCCCCWCWCFLLRCKKSSSSGNNNKHENINTSNQSYWKLFEKKKILCIKYLQLSKYFYSLHILGIVSAYIVICYFDKFFDSSTLHPKNIMHCTLMAKPTLKWISHFEIEILRW